MCSGGFRVFRLLLYKNFLVLKRNWKMALFVEILIPIILFASIWVSRDLVSKPPLTIPEKTYPIETKEQLLPRDIGYLNVVPDNPFTESFANDVRKCLKMNPDALIISRFNTEEDMFKVYKVNHTKYVDENMISVIFENRSIDFSTKDLVYKIQMPKSLSKTLYDNKLVYREDEFIKKTVGLQLCLDESFIKMKIKDNLFSVLIYTQKLPTLRHQEPHMRDYIFRQLFCVFALLALFFPLCIETSRASDEKFLGTTMLMSMNGVSYCSNILSWLFTGLIFSIFYTVPIILLLHFSATICNALAIPFFYYGNPIIYWIIITLHVTHLIAFGLHLSSYFPRAFLLVTGITIIYLGTTMITIFGIKESAYPIVPIIGIIFPNMLLYRAFEEINYYESISVGLQWNNLFKVGNPAYGCGESIGMILIFSFVGMILHYILCIFVYNQYPGKYGISKSQFNCLKCCKGSGKGEKIENLKYENNGKEPFEPVEGAGAPIIRIRDLKKYYNTHSCNKTKIHALKGISIDFFQGKITALIGQTGAGITTLISILTGLITPTKGIALIDGKNVKKCWSEIIKDVGLCPQENMLFQSLSVAEQLEFFGMLKNRSKSKAAIREDIKTLLHKLKLFEKRNALPYELSGGQKRQLCLAIALIGDSSILILDEPTAGLDPECKRDIWDILLKMRGERTILISTQDMEEADVLSDRIAVLHNGNLKAYGSPLFLKKLLGKGNIEVTLSVTESRCDPQKILSYLDPQSQILKSDGSKLQLSVPYTAELPDSLDKIENNRAELGITGICVSLITLEQAFLKITQEHETGEPRKSFKDSIEKLEGGKLFMHSTKALMRKKMIYTTKNLPTFFVVFLLFIIPLLLVILILMDYTASINTFNAVKIRLDMYNQPHYSYRHDKESKLYGVNYKIYAEKFSGKRIDHLKEDRNFTAALMEFGERDPLDYEYKPLAAAEFTRDSNAIRATALYNAKKTQYAEPISVNLLTNALIKTLIGTDHSISMSIQELPHKKDRSLLHDLINKITIFRSYAIAFVLSIFLYAAMALFVIHPMGETRSNFKHLQRMAGLSYFGYWGTMFAFDFIVYLIMMLIVLVGFIIIDTLLGLGMFGIIEVLIMITSLVLFGINILPLVYIFSFAMTPIKNIINILTLIPIAFVSVELMKDILIEFDIIDTSNIVYRVQKELFALIPFVSFFNAQIAFFRIISTNSDCKRISKHFNVEELCMHNTTCCAMNCNNGTCKNPLNYYNSFSDNISLEGNILSLCISPKFYFILLSILEYKIIQNIYASLRRSKPKGTDDTFEDDMIRVKNKIGSEISKIKSRSREDLEAERSIKGSIETIESGTEIILPKNRDPNSPNFLAHELRKLYGRVPAIQDLSFAVNCNDCFGLIGVNGSGKSTTFKIITGQVIPNNGKLYLGNLDVRKTRNNLLAQMGYCPQRNTLLKSLNAFDHLRLFARIRGIPEDKVDTEAQKWINRLNLNACASQQSGTYSNGDKRRLNIAIALIGLPNLILLDEPTNSIDPAARRSLWNVLQSCQNSGQAVIMSTHSMEECDVLCNKIAVLVDGKFHCIGASQKLKQRYGSGYNIQLKLNPEKSKNEIYAIKQDMDAALKCEIMDENSGYLMYHVPIADTTWRQMYDLVSELKDKYSSIEDFSVLSSTMEQLFLCFAKNSDRSNRKYN